MALRPFRFGVVVARAASAAAWLDLARRVEGLGYATLLTPDRLDLNDVIQARSIAVVGGGMDQMCAHLLDRRERLGISYLTVADDMMDAFAPVVARLAGR